MNKRKNNVGAGQQFQKKLENRLRPQRAFRRSRGALYLAPVFLALGGTGQAQVARTITNTSFETPSIALGCQGYVYESRVPGWKTADTLLTSATTAGFDNPNGCVGSNGTMPSSGTRVFEFYSNGVRDNQSGLNIDARDGQQFVELSAESASRLYQPMCLIAGETVGFKFSHLGRMSNSVEDVAAFYVGGTSTLKSGTKVVQIGDTWSGSGSVTSALSTNTVASRGSLAYSGTSRYWYDYSGSFVVPSGLSGSQNLSFEAVSNSTGNTAYGNFVDAIQVTLNPFVEFLGSTTSEVESSGGANLPKIRVVGVVPVGGVTVAVSIRAAGTTASSPSDYTGTANITIPAGTYDGGTTSQFKIPLTVVDDKIGEPTEQIIFDLGTGAGYTVAGTQNCGASASASATHTIIDDDISGRVYEDYNYGGGAGRAYDATKGMNPRPGARVELYNSAATFVNSTVTDSNGQYSFSNLAPGTYTVRVVNSTVTSSRNTSASGVIAVQTYNGSSQVGGANPQLIDAPAGAAGTVLSSLSTTAATPESVATVTVGGSAVASTDFGYNFDTVVNTNAAGQGSLAQFITNSNALAQSWAGGTLAQAGQRSRDGVAEALPTATETSIFMIPKAALTSGVAVISPGDGATATTSVLPAVTDSYTSIDGTTQTVNIGDTNAGVIGTGGAVGYINTLTLTQVPRPEVQITGPAAATNQATTAGYGLILNGANQTLRGVSILGFGGNNDAQGNVFAKTANSALLEQNFLGMTATGSLCMSSSTATGVGSGLWATNSTGGVLTHNILSCNGGNGAHIHAGTSGWSVSNNEFRGNAMNTNNADGLNLASGSATNAVRGNLFIDNNANGTDSYNGGGNNIYESNTIKNNGMGGSKNEIPGMRVYSKNNIIRYNLIQDNYGSGILIVNYNSASEAMTGNLISKNSISGNGDIVSKTGGAASRQIGIDLMVVADGANLTSGLSPYVTPNDSGDADVGGNNGLNFPVFDTAFSDGTNVYLTGWAPAGSTIELFIAAPDAGGFGEGKTYLATLTEGSATDTDAATSTYVNRVIGSIGGLATQTGTDTTSRFRFVLPLSSLPGVSTSTSLTATATDSSSNTSEFSPVILVGAQPNVSLIKYVRNTSVSGQKFSTGGADGRPKDVLQYCIAFKNTGGFAPNFNLQDNIPASTTLVAGSLLYSSPATDLTLSSVSPVAATLPVNASLTQAANGGPVVYNTNSTNTAPATGLAASQSGIMCFSAVIK